MMPRPLTVSSTPESILLNRTLVILVALLWFCPWMACISTGSSSISTTLCIMMFKGTDWLRWATLWRLPPTDWLLDRMLSISCEVMGELNCETTNRVVVPVLVSVPLKFI